MALSKQRGNISMARKSCMIVHIYQKNASCQYLLVFYRKIQLTCCKKFGTKIEVFVQATRKTYLSFLLNN